jgi:hypothetical protein
MECDPKAREDVVKVACAPEVPELRVAVPRVVLPSLNVTVPVGVPPDPLTVAVNVTDWPDDAGSAEEAREVTLLLFEDPPEPPEVKVN